MLNEWISSEMLRDNIAMQVISKRVGVRLRVLDQSTTMNSMLDGKRITVPQAKEGSF